jgi:toxin ParE1/3/4
MSGYTLAPLALIDIEDIGFYIALDSPSRSDTFIDRLHGRFEYLSRNPGVGRPRNDLLPGVRCYSLGRYMIFYRGQRGSVEVLRVYHASRNPDTLRLM